MRAAVVFAALALAAPAAAHTPVSNYSSNPVPVWFAGHWHADVVYGSRYGDIIEGRGGPDRMYGQYGDDEIHGGNGDDEIHGGAGLDICYGGGGIDIFSSCERVRA